MSDHEHGDGFDGWTEEALVRQWWYEYAEVLRRGGTGSLDGLRRVQDAIDRRGFLPQHGPMTRKGAEDLASRCDGLRGRGG